MPDHPACRVRGKSAHEHRKTIRTGPMQARPTAAGSGARLSGEHHGPPSHRHPPAESHRAHRRRPRHYHQSQCQCDQPPFLVDHRSLMARGPPTIHGSGDRAITTLNVDTWLRLASAPQGWRKRDRGESQACCAIGEQAFNCGQTRAGRWPIRWLRYPAEPPLLVWGR